MLNKINWDALGIGTSVICAIHCAVLPLIATSLPLFGINLVHHSGFDWVMIALAFGIGMYTFLAELKKHHSYLPLILFIVGLACLIARQWFHDWEMILLVPAVLCIIVAHVLNFRLSKVCRAGRGKQ